MRNILLVLCVLLPCVFSLTCWFQTPGVLTKQDCIPIVHNTCATITTVSIKDGKTSNSISKACSNDLLGCNSLCKETIKQVQRLDPSINVTSCNAQCFYGDLSNNAFSTKGIWPVILIFLLFSSPILEKIAL